MKYMYWMLNRSRPDRFCARLVVLIGLGVFVSSASPAHAAKMYFGTQEYLRSIQDVAIKGPGGEDLYLGYKYSFYSFVMPYSLSDDGYILGVKGRDSYIRLDKASIEKFQTSGLLPSPLPAYELSTLDYVMGHALWGALVIMAAIFVIKRLRKKRWLKQRRRANPYFENAIGHGKNGDLDRAIADYTRAIEIAPDFESALINRGVSCERRGDYDQAIADFTKAIKIGPKSVTVIGLVNRGIAYHKKGDFDRAIADHTRAIKASQAAGAYYNRGNSLVGNGDYASAIADYTKAIALEPNSATAYQARGGVYDKQGDAILAQADYKIALEIAGRQGSTTQ
jgi:tetratricopeptide (TPR) repeat protein